MAETRLSAMVREDCPSEHRLPDYKGTEKCSIENEICRTCWIEAFKKGAVRLESKNA